MTETTPAETQLAPVPHAGRLLLLFVAVFFGCCLLSLALPSDRYVRYQQLGTSSMFHAEWAYERMTFDRTPIDVAIIGASRVQTSVSAPELQVQLGAALGRPVHVVNFGIAREGRDLHYELTRQLLATHPEVKLILYSISEQTPRDSNPAFRSVADVGQVAGEPLLLNRDYADDVAYLPYRQISAFLQTWLPGLFHTHLAFDPARYRGTDFDTTRSYWSPRGAFVDRDSTHPEAELRKAARAEIGDRNPAFLPMRMRDYEYAIERHYTRAIESLLKGHGTSMGFLYVPVYTYDGPIADLDFYKPRGPVLQADFVADDYRNYSDFGHLNRIGAAKVTPWVAEQLLQLQRAGTIDLVPAKRPR